MGPLSIMQLYNLFAFLPLVLSSPLGNNQIATIQNAGDALKLQLANWYQMASQNDPQSTWDTRYSALYDNHYQKLYDVCYQLADFAGAAKDQKKLARFLMKKVMIIQSVIAAWHQMDAVAQATAENAADAADVAAKFAAAAQAKLEAAQVKFAAQQENAAAKASRASDKKTTIEETAQLKANKVADKNAAAARKAASRAAKELKKAKKACSNRG